MGPANATYPAAAGITMNAVPLRPRASITRNPPRSPSVHREDRAGNSAVMIDTAKMACGSWNRMNAAV